MTSGLVNPLSARWSATEKEFRRSSVTSMVALRRVAASSASPTANTQTDEKVSLERNVTPGGNQIAASAEKPRITRITPTTRLAESNPCSNGRSD